MRFAIAAVLFIVAIFGFFIGFTIGSYTLDHIYTALETPANNLLESNNSASYLNTSTLIKTGFGIICSIIFVVITLIFILDSLGDEPEYYWRE